MVLALLVGLVAAGTAQASRPHGLRAAPAVAGSGKIKGTVTDAGTHAAIKGVEVCAYRLPLFEAACTETGASGTYELEVPAGEYVVEFFATNLNYVTIYQHGDSSAEEAEEDPVTVPAGGAETVNAAMTQGGHITGHVASAAPPESPIEAVEVCASRIPSEPEAFGCGATDTGGDYEISGLPGGKYEVFFFPPVGSNYIGQARKVQVAVTAGATTSGIDALLALGGEISGEVIAAPAKQPLSGAEVCALVSETEAERCTETSSKGLYALHGLPPGTYEVGFSDHGYQWQYYPSGKTFSLATPITVAAGSGVGLLAVELLPLGYVPPPPVTPSPVPPATTGPPPAPPVPPTVSVAGATVHVPAISLSSTRLRASHGRIAVKLSCAGAACSGTVHLQMRVAYRVRRHGHTVMRHRMVVLAAGTYSLAAGARATVSLHETAAGRARLAHASHTAVLAALIGSVSGGAALTAGVHIS